LVYKALFDFYPEIAKVETRSVLIRGLDDPIPDGDYGFIELFCTDPAWDCRRVLFRVSNQDFEPFAMIGYGWESEEFYRKWFGPSINDKSIIRDFMGPSHHDGLKPSKYSDFFLEFFTHELLIDQEYIERIKSHCRLVKSFLRK
jgi:hypothetical protein